MKAAAPVEPLTAADAQLTADPNKLMAAPSPDSSVPAAASLAGAPAAEPIVIMAQGSAASAPQAVAAAPAPSVTASQRPAGVPAEPIVELARHSLLERGHNLLAGLTLTVAQLLDLPFGWLDDLSKNVIGMAAFLLLAGGAVLWVLSHVLVLGGG